MGPSVFLGFGSDFSWCWAWMLPLILYPKCPVVNKHKGLWSHHHQKGAVTHKGQLVPCQLCPAGEMQKLWDMCASEMPCWACGYTMARGLSASEFLAP